METLPKTLAKAQDRGRNEFQELERVNDFLRERYDACVHHVHNAGLPDWPKQIVHSDWHPGNMLYRGSRVMGVIDYDTARRYQRIIDTANGALQFSMVGGGEDPSTWPDRLDTRRFKTFLEGYEGVPHCVLSKAEIRVVPELMIEALIAESVIPIANTGKFATLEGGAFIRMLERKVRWLQENRDKLVALLEEG
jgi:homoserine kinase type II